MSAPEKCPRCGAQVRIQLTSVREYECRSHDDMIGFHQTDVCLSRDVEHITRQRDQLAARVKELEEAAACLREHLLLRVDRCKNCQGTGQNNDGEGFLDEACPDCEEDRIALALHDNKAKEKP